MARFVFWSDSGDSAFLARRLQREGHQVQLYIDQRPARMVGAGLIPKLLTPVIPPGAVVLFDGVGHGAIGRTLRQRGHAVLGGNPFDVDLEINRTKGTALMREHGIAVPRTETFRDCAEAQAFLADAEGDWFFKPSGNQSTSFTQNGDPATLSRYLAWAVPQLKGRPPFELQQKVAGTEVSCEGWFDGTRFVPPFNSTFEDKKFLVGDLGPRAGCSANVVWRWDHDALPQLTVARLEERLRAERYVGPIDLNMIVDDAGIPHGLEWSARFGFDALQALSLLVEGDFGQQLDAFVHGRLAHFEVRPDLALTLRVSMPPYPRDDPAGAPAIRGIPVDDRLATHPRCMADDVMRQGDGLVCAGRDGALGVVGALGDDLALMRERVLALAHDLAVPSLQYRTDPVERAEKAWSVLDDFGLGREGAGGTAAATGA